MLINLNNIWLTLTFWCILRHLSIIAKSTSMKTVLKKNSARDSKKGLKQDADVQCSVVLYP